MLTVWCNQDDGPAEQRKDTLTVMDGVVNLTESAITQEGHGPLSTWGDSLYYNNGRGKTHFNVDRTIIEKVDGELAYSRHCRLLVCRCAGINCLMLLLLCLC